MSMRTALAVAIVTVFAFQPKAQADAARDFIVSCSYGVLAGTLVGAATLAFSEKPGENLNRVARGASLGLYGGILLGAYVVYGVPGEDEDAASLLNRAENSEGSRMETRIAMNRPRFLLAPLFNERGLDGVSAQVQVLGF